MLSIYLSCHQQQRENKRMAVINLVNSVLRTHCVFKREIAFNAQLFIFCLETFIYNHSEYKL